MIEIRPTIESDLGRLAETMRKEDIEEVLALGQSPIEALQYGFEYSEPCLTATSNGEIVAIFGVVPKFSAGIIWLLGSDLIQTNKIEFLRKSEKVLDNMSAPFDYVMNCVDRRNDVHLKWLHWLKFDEIGDVIINGLPFAQVVKKVL